MSKTVYFDTNVFDHIHKQIGVTEADLLAPRAAVKTGKIAILSSILNFEETLSILESSPSLSVTVLQLILELTDGQKLIKPPELLLPDAIRGYAKGETLSSPFLVNPGIQSNIKALVTSTQQNMNKLLTVVRETQKQKEDFRTAMKTAQDQAAPYVRRIKGQQPHFSDYWAKCAPKLAESLAERAGVLNACKEQGIEGLLEIRSVRLCVGANLSLIYAQDFEGRTPKMGDSRDLQHALLASAAEIFVTHDKQFARVLARIPITGFQVLDLHTLLQQVC